MKKPPLSPIAEKVCGTELVQSSAIAVIKAFEKIDKLEKLVEENRKAAEIKKDPMHEWHTIGTD